MKAIKIQKEGVAKNILICPETNKYISDSICCKCPNLRIVEWDHVKCLYNIENTITFTGRDNNIEDIQIQK